MFGSKAQADSAAIREVLAGKRERFGELVARYLPSVYATALAHTRNPADADDVVQDTFINAYTALDTLRTPAKFGPWVLTIARNMARQHLRKKPVTSPAADAVHMESPAATAQRKELLAVLSGAMATLNEHERETILLHYFAGQSAREIADALDINRTAVLKRLQRGREHIGEQLLRDVGDEQTLKHDFLPSAERVMQGVLAATAAWQLAKTASGDGMVAAGAAGLSKVTAASCLAIAAIAAAGSWGYFTRANNSAVAADDDRTADSIVASDPDPAIQDTAPELQQADAVTPVSRPSDTRAADEVIADPVLHDNSATTRYTTVDGIWTLRFYAPQAGEEGLLGRARITGDGTQLAPESDEDRFNELVQDYQRAGDHVQVTLGMPGGPVMGVLEGGFNAEMTRLEVSGPVQVEELSEPILMRIIGDRATEEDLLREAQVDELEHALRELLTHLHDYARANKGDFPEDLQALYPRHVLDLERLQSNKTRSLIYHRPPSLYIYETAKSATAVTSQEDLLAIERYLIEQYGNFFRANALVLESEHFESGIRVGLTFSGQRVDLAEEEQAKREHKSDANIAKARQEALLASCQNNMKQLGLSFKMFENEQAAEMFPPGFHAMYPEYLPDLNVLTCPSSDPGDISYEVVFPAATEAALLDFGRQIEGVGNDPTDHAFISATVPLIIETDECSGSGKRGVLFLDGHAETLTDDEWQIRVAPYLEP